MKGRPQCSAIYPSFIYFILFYEPQFCVYEPKNPLKQRLKVCVVGCMLSEAPLLAFITVYFRLFRLFGVYMGLSALTEISVTESLLSSSASCFCVFSIVTTMLLIETTTVCFILSIPKPSFILHLTR